MFKKLYNQVKISFKVEPLTPLLIQSGKPGLDPTLPDMRFVRTKSTCGEVVYIPGSSLKGVIRSYSEKLLRTMGIEICDVTVNSCDKVYNEYIEELKRFEEKEKQDQSARKPSLPKYFLITSFVKDKGSKELPEKIPYRAHCYACRTFGSTSLSSHTRIVDAYPWSWEMDQEKKRKSVDKVMSSSMVRTGVSINREKGAVSHGPFDFEVITEGTFYGEITIRNFQLWQLTLLLSALRDINEGYQQIGYAKSRGLGRVNLDTTAMEIESYGQLAEIKKEKIVGVGEIKQEKETYGLIENDSIIYPDVYLKEKEPFRKVVKLEGKQRIDSFLEALLKSDNWNNLLERRKK
jgi:CRISPR-associated protein Csm3